jgi:uncharacterized membrane protein YtjA (UPF0391 family)
MIRWAILFLVFAVIAAILGFGGIAAMSVDIARMLFFVFIVLFLITAVLHLVRGGKGPLPPIS